MARSTRLDRDALARTLGQQLDVITRQQALAVGMTRHALRHRLRPEGAWQSVLPGVYIAATGTPTVSQSEMAALLYAGRPSLITGPAALRSHHIRIASPELIDVLVPTTTERSSARFVRLHRTTRMPETWSLGSLRYAPPVRAVADAVRGMSSLRDVRAVVADAVQRGHCKVTELAAELAAGPKAGSALFRTALTDVTEGIRSSAEADLKDLLKRSRLPVPLFNAQVFAGETFVATPDAWWPEFGVAIEVDSQEWHLSPEDHANTLARGRRMSEHQIIVLRFTPRQIRTQRTEVLAEIRRTLDRARNRPPLDLRTVPADQTRPCGRQQPTGSDRLGA
jgi:very-short-patch-repair endonuclease